MGLDMYVERTLKQESEDVLYWRKENALQGWFEENYEIENCGKVILTKEVVDKLLTDLKEHTLKPTEGFFYGYTKGQELSDTWYAERILEFTKLKQEIIDNPEYEYYYTCWY